MSESGVIVEIIIEAEGFLQSLERAAYRIYVWLYQIHVRLGVAALFEVEP